MGIIFLIACIFQTLLQDAVHRIGSFIFGITEQMAIDKLRRCGVRMAELPCDRPDIDTCGDQIGRCHMPEAVWRDFWQAMCFDKAAEPCVHGRWATGISVPCREQERFL